MWQAYGGAEFVLKQVATTLEYNGTSEVTIANAETNTGIKVSSAGLVAYDQFGTKITGNDADVTLKAATVTAVNSGGKYAESGSAQYNVTGGVVDFTAIVTGTSKGVDINDGFDVKVLDKTFEFRAVQTIGAAIGTTAHATNGTGTVAQDAFSIKLASKELATPLALKAQTFTNEDEFARALSVAESGKLAGCTITSATTATLSITGDYTIPSNVEVVQDVAGTYTFSGKITNKGKITAANTKICAFTGTLDNYGTLASSAAADILVSGTLIERKDSTAATAVTLNGATLIYQREADAAKDVYVLGTGTIKLGADAGKVINVTAAGQTTTAGATHTGVNATTNDALPAGTDVTTAHVAFTWVAASSTWTYTFTAS